MLPERRVLEPLRGLDAIQRAELARAIEVESRRIGFLYRPQASKPPIPHPLALTPMVVPRNRVPLLRDLGSAIARLHVALPGLYREGIPEVLMACPLVRRSREWLALLPRDRSPSRMLLRLDVGFTADAEPVLFETNATAVAGFFYHPAAVRMLREVVLPRLGLARGLGLGATPDLTDMLFRWLKRTCGNGPIGFIEEPPFGPGDTEMPGLARIFARRGLRCVWGAPWEVRQSRGGFRLRGQPVQWLFRDLNLHELPEPGGRMSGFEAMARAGRVLPGPGAEFDHKGMLELMTSKAFEFVFEPAQRRLLRRCVPWTRVVYERNTDGPTGKRVDLLPFIARDPAHWVLKPNRGCGGEGVILGRESPALWRRTLREAVRRPGAWVVQERRDTLRLPIAIARRGRVSEAACYYSLGVFSGAGLYGFYGRVNPRPIVNVARGGAVAAVFLR